MAKKMKIRRTWQRGVLAIALIVAAIIAWPIVFQQSIVMKNAPAQFLNISEVEFSSSHFSCVYAEYRVNEIDLKAIDSRTHFRVFEAATIIDILKELPREYDANTIIAKFIEECSSESSGVVLSEKRRRIAWLEREMSLIFVGYPRGQIWAFHGKSRTLIYLGNTIY